MGSTVLDALTRGKGLVHIVTIPEGFFASHEHRSALVRTLYVPADSVMRPRVTRRCVIVWECADADGRGISLPGHRTFQEGTTARAAVGMVQRFEQVWKPEWTARLDTIHLSRNDVMSLAAIVEKEARLPQERPVIAAVYLNRLRTGMLLQADPTVQYALGKHVARVLYKDLEVDSPYNTYKRKGLPPGPIASPGRASIEAALYPAANAPYLYFVAFPDGHHEFRETFAEHTEARAQIRREHPPRPGAR